jgi:molecular chaperone DnaJ
LADHYRILGIEKDASDEEIKAAYRRLALKFHPDQNLGNALAEEQFQLLSKAYEVLGDGVTRSFYDRVGLERDALENMARSSKAASVGRLVADVFDDVLGNKGGAVQRGRDFRYALEIAFLEGARGGAHSIEVPSESTCSDCAGSGADDGGASEPCHVCEGTGEVEGNRPILKGLSICPFCQGKGNVVSAACGRCEGSGVASGTQVLSFEIPQGTRSGTRLKYRGAGGMGRRGGDQGDLFIVIDVRDDAVLQREGEDIVVRFPLSVREAVEGARIQVPTLGSPVSVTVPAGSRSGTRLRLKGQGLVSRDGTRRGHLYIEMEMAAPVDALDRLAEWVESNAALADRLPPEREKIVLRVAEDLDKAPE